MWDWIAPDDLWASEPTDTPTDRPYRDDPPISHKDITSRLIAAKAGYGLARPKWFKTLEQIRAQPVEPRE